MKFVMQNGRRIITSTNKTEKFDVLNQISASIAQPSEGRAFRTTRIRLLMIASVQVAACAASARTKPRTIAMVTAQTTRTSVVTECTRSDGTVKMSIVRKNTADGEGRTLAERL